MILAAAIAWESVALVTALTGGGTLGVVKIVKAVKANGAVTEDRVKTLVHEETDPIRDDITDIKGDVREVKTRCEDILTILRKDD